MKPMQIAIDAMGGDHAPGFIVSGSLAAARQFGFGLILVGRREVIERQVGRQARGCVVDIVDTPEAIGMGESPAAGLRRQPRASVKLAAELVRSGEAAAFFSAGNTGATVMAAHSTFGMLAGIDRPALATTIPTRSGLAVLLDSGATTGCRPHHLVQFGAMGASYARVAHDIARPRVGLLAIGEEESKGTSAMREAHRLMKESGLHFVGNVEASDLYLGNADVIVCDGVTGNIALKVSEGLVESMERVLRRELSSSVWARAGFLLARRAFQRVRRRVDYSEQGGAPLLGVSGLCIVGHGRLSPKAVRSGVAMAARLASRNFIAAAVPALAVSGRPAAALESLRPQS